MRSSTLGEDENAIRILVYIGQQNIPTGKPRDRWDSNVETDININYKVKKSTDSEHNSVARFSGSGNEHISVILVL